jgi:hypothetical protein
MLGSNCLPTNPSARPMSAALARSYTSGANSTLLCPTTPEITTGFEFHLPSENFDHMEKFEIISSIDLLPLPEVLHVRDFDERQKAIKQAA